MDEKQLGSPIGTVQPPRVQAALGRLPTLMQGVMGDLLQQHSRGYGFASPRDWDEPVAELMVKGIVDACRACADYRFEVTGIECLASKEALKVIRMRVKDGIWGGVNLYRVLVCINKLHRVATGNSPRRLTKMISRYRKWASRNQWPLVRTPQEYIRGGLAVAAFAEIADAAGKHHRGASLLRDGAMLAVAAELCFRRSEYHKTDKKRIRLRNDKQGEYAEVYLPKAATKHRVGVIGGVYDPDALKLLKTLTADKESGPLFPNGRGGGLSAWGVADALRRTSMLVFGVPVTANLLRRSGVSSEQTSAAKARRLGKSEGGSRTGLELKVYSGSMASEGRELIKSGLAAYAHSHQKATSVHPFTRLKRPKLP